MSSRIAKSLRSAAVIALGSAVALGASDHGSRAAEEPAVTVACVRAWPEARYRNYGYDHIVHLYNGCSAAARCRVSTDVAPAPIDVALAVGEKREVVTFRGSPSSQFAFQVSCELED